MSTEIIRERAAELLSGDDGHGFDHVERVGSMALRFAQQESADLQIVEFAALLHDVDDYKLFGEDAAKNLTNATTILEESEVDQESTKAVLDIIRTMGYNKYLDGIRPQSLEGKIVSDADMCDAIGAEGILRTHAYALSQGHPFFDQTLRPSDIAINGATYRAGGRHSAQHFFDKLLVLPSIMLTMSGQEEALKRKKIMVDFLKELFRENEAKEWLDALEDFQN